MLYSIDGNKIENVPHKSDYDWLRSRLTQSEYLAIIEAIHRDMNRIEIFNSSFLPGKDWTDTPFQPIYEICGDQDQAALMYGLMCWVAVQDHSDDWVGYPSDGKDKQAQKSLGRGWTYFKKNQQPLKFKS
jgi:hypothetical protein